MPLDTGALDTEAQARFGDDLASLRPATVTLEHGSHLGADLAAARRSLDLAVEDIASATRVRTRYVIAIEAFDFDALPSRPFVIGYVRAYAMALGLDADAVVARFRAEAPPVPDELKPPVGVERRVSLAPRIVGFVAVLIVGSVAAWNVWRHAEAAPLRAMPAPPPPAAAPTGPVSLGAPLPTPPEASTPPTYQTPGLPPSSAPATATAPVDPAATPGRPFSPAGTIYGAAAPGAGVILQARTATPLVIRGAGGEITFARQLAAGEAWRAPATSGLTVDVGSPSSVEVFVGGQSHGVLTEPKTALSAIAAGTTGGAG